MIYAVYDTTGIQSYIFASTKLKENIGASMLVSKVFTEYLPEVLRNKCEFGEGNVLTDWESQLDVENWILENTAEIIYVGGGNAYVAYKTVKDYKKATAAFLKTVYEKTATIGIASAYIEVDVESSYSKNHNCLMQRLSQAKGEINRPIIAGSQPITKTSLLTGRPVTRIVDGEFLSEDQYLKRKANKVGLDEFDKLKRGKTSFLGVLHVDGNNIGKYIEKYMKSNDDSGDKWCCAVPRIREMSHRLSKLYEKAYESAETKFKKFYEESKSCEKYRNENKNLPLLKPIGDGDEFTCVITGLWGISFAVLLLQEIEAHGKCEDLYPFKEWYSRTDKPNISACAGVVLFHSHYPFSEAYKMAEECCKNAKKYTRNAEEYTNGVVGSFIDFHIHNGGTITSLKSLRKSIYTIKTEQALTHRPYCISNMSETNDGTFNKYPSFDEFETLIHELTQQNGINSWPRSRLKALRDAIAIGEDEVKKVLTWCEARDYKLPEGADKLIIAPEDNKDKNSIYKYSLLFSAMEFADIYEKIEMEDK